jgi:hypothetical protein
MHERTADQESTDKVRWVGEIHPETSTLGLQQLNCVQRATLYQASEQGDSFSHHGYITHHEGILFASWSNHRRDEDAPGQRVCFSVSSDGGHNWQSPAELFPARDRIKVRADADGRVDRVVIPNGFAPVGDRLYAVAEVHLLGESKEFAPPEGLGQAKNIIKRKFLTRPGPGRLARSLGPEGQLGPVFWLVGDPPEPKPGFPDYPAASDPAFSGTAQAIRNYLGRPENLPTWEFVNQSTRTWSSDGHRLCEPTQCWNVHDEIWARLWRDASRGSGVQYQQVSTDDRRTWRAPEPSEFPDAYSRAAAGNLPDGTAYVVNNPGTDRDPLVLSLADDGLNFDRHILIASQAPPMRYKGVAKNPGYQYPRAAVSDEMLFVIYSVNKEDVEVAAIPLEELAHD